MSSSQEKQSKDENSLTNQSQKEEEDSISRESEADVEPPLDNEIQNHNEEEESPDNDKNQNIENPPSDATSGNGHDEGIENEYDWETDEDDISDNFMSDEYSYSYDNEEEDEEEEVDENGQSKPSHPKTRKKRRYVKPKKQNYAMLKSKGLPTFLLPDEWTPIEITAWIITWAFAIIVPFIIYLSFLLLIHHTFYPFFYQWISITSQETIYKFILSILASLSDFCIYFLLITILFSIVMKLTTLLKVIYFDIMYALYDGVGDLMDNVKKIFTIRKRKPEDGDDQDDHDDQDVQTIESTVNQPLNNEENLDHINQILTNNLDMLREATHNINEEATLAEVQRQQALFADFEKRRQINKLEAAKALCKTFIAIFPLIVIEGLFIGGIFYFPLLVILLALIVLSILVYYTVIPSFKILRYFDRWFDKCPPLYSGEKFADIVNKKTQVKTNEEEKSDNSEKSEKSDGEAHIATKEEIKQKKREEEERKEKNKLLSSIGTIHEYSQMLMQPRSKSEALTFVYKISIAILVAIGQIYVIVQSCLHFKESNLYCKIGIIIGILFRILSFVRIIDINIYDSLISVAFSGKKIAKLIQSEYKVKDPLLKSKTIVSEKKGNKIIQNIEETILAESKDGTRIIQRKIEKICATKRGKTIQHNEVKLYAESRNIEIANKIIEKLFDESNVKKGSIKRIEFSNGYIDLLILDLKKVEKYPLIIKYSQLYSRTEK